MNQLAQIFVAWEGMSLANVKAPDRKPNSHRCGLFPSFGS
jgi:hypothetical protein